MLSIINKREKKTNTAFNLYVGSKKEVTEKIVKDVGVDKMAW